VARSEGNGFPVGSSSHFPPVRDGRSRRTLAVLCAREPAQPTLPPARDTAWAMSQENVETLRQSNEAFDRRDRAAWLATRDPDCEVIPSATWPEVDAIRGREAAWDFYVKIADAFERLPVDFELVDAGADKVLVHWRHDVRGRASGADVEINYWIAVTFRAGRIARDQWFADRDRAEALEAAGLSE
jgi:ketosteroid isomerase-like protein